MLKAVLKVKTAVLKVKITVLKVEIAVLKVNFHSDFSPKRNKGSGFLRYGKSRFFSFEHGIFCPVKRSLFGAPL